MLDKELLNAIPESDTNLETMGRGMLIDVVDVKKHSRALLKTWVDPEKVYSLDEDVGTVVAMTSVALATGSLVFGALRFSLGWLSVVSTVFFWIAYRYAKARHSIELRLGVISGFVMFFFFSVFYLAAMTYTTIAQPFPQDMQTLLTLPFSFVILVMLFLLQLDYPKKAIRRIWNIIAREPVKYRRMGSYEESLKMDVEALALIAYPVSVAYGALANFLILYSIVSLTNPLSVIVTVVGSVFLLGFLMWIFESSLKVKSYEYRLIEIANAKATYLRFQPGADSFYQEL